MKKINYLSLLFVLIPFVLLQNSCSNDSDEDLNNNLEPVDILIAVDENNETANDLQIFNSLDNSASFVNLNENGFVEKIDYLNTENKQSGTIHFNKNGFIESIGIDDFTIVCDNYEEGTVDIALLYKDEIRLIEDYSYGTLKKSRSALDNGNNFLSKLNTTINQLEWLQDFVKDLNFAQLNGPKSSIQWLLKCNFDLLNNIVSKRGKIKQADLAFIMDCLNVHLDAMDDIYIAKKFGAWGMVYVLIHNYDDLVDFVEEVTTYFLEKNYNYEKQREEGLGMLKSGIGSLKITLNWDFYADIDLLVMEPSQNIIFWKNPNSPNSDGFLDVDNRNGGRGATENIYWKMPPEGEYVIALNHYGESMLNGQMQSGICRVNIVYKGRGVKYSVPVPVGSLPYVAVINIPTGIVVPFDSYSNNKFSNFKIKTSSLKSK